MEHFSKYREFEFRKISMLIYEQEEIETRCLGNGLSNK